MLKLIKQIEIYFESIVKVNRIVGKVYPPLLF